MKFACPNAELEADEKAACPERGVPPVAPKTWNGVGCPKAGIFMEKGLLPVPAAVACAADWAPTGNDGSEPDAAAVSEEAVEAAACVEAPADGPEGCSPGRDG